MDMPTSICLPKIKNNLHLWNPSYYFMTAKSFALTVVLNAVLKFSAFGLVNSVA